MKKHDKYEQNPFLVDLQISEKSELKKIIDSGAKIVDKGHEVDLKVVYASEKIRERARFLKVYDNDLSYLINLTKPGLIMFVYLCKQLRVNKDRVLLNSDDAHEKYHISIRNAKEGILNLIDNSIIARTNDTNIYFLNPKLIYRGERRFLLHPDNQY